MALNMKSFTQALGIAAAAIEKTVHSTVHEVTGPKALQDYELGEQVGSGGPGLVWKLYSGMPRNKATQLHNSQVCVWVLDKKALSESRVRNGVSRAVEEAFLDLLRQDAAQMMRLRHPGVIRVVQALDESKTTMAIVTEPIFASVANVLGSMDNVAKVPAELKDLELGQLEIKHGLLQLAESLSFLHTNARLIHCAISPESVYITASGAWKLAGFGFAVNMGQPDPNSGPTFHFSEYDVEDVDMPLYPPLDYTAPELTRKSNTGPSASTDIFSLALLAYHLLSRQSLLQCKNNLRTYASKVSFLANESFSNIPSDIVKDLRLMLNVDEVSRPSALDFTGSAFFRDDTRLRALRFLDHMLERDNMQKTQFLKALADMWTGFDARVLRYKVLPPLCAELRNEIMQPMVLPMVLTIADSQEKVDFVSSTLPALLPVLGSATGDTLLLLVKHAGLLINKVGADVLATNVVPMVVRAFEDPDARMQEEVLKRTLTLTKQLDFTVLKESILPRVHGLALKTTMAAVRVNALLCLGEVVPRLDKPAVLEVLQTLQRCTAVDHSAPTLMCTLGVASAIFKQLGTEFAAEHLLPLLCPLLIAQQLNLQQFAKYMHFVKEVIRKIEEKRGVVVNEAEPVSLDVKSMALSDPAKENVSATSNSTKTNSWDSDWDVSKGKTKTAGGGATIVPSKAPSQIPSLSTAPTTSPVVPSLTTMDTSQQQLSSLSFEWPPAAPLAAVQAPNLQPGNAIVNTGNATQTSRHTSLDFGKSSFGSGMINQSSTNTGLNGGFGSVSLEATAVQAGEDDFDPFADWPPRSGSAATNTVAVGGISRHASWGSGLGASKDSMLKTSNPPLSMSEWSIPSAAQSTPQPAPRNVEDFFVSPKAQDSNPLKLAPPPPSGLGLGKGRGRNPMRPLRSSKANNQTSGRSDQPPLLDLL